jgi:LPXTG-motif cell wall-anchored protein
VNRTPFPSRRRLRRLAVLATGAMLGLGGVFAIAAPASAHKAEVVGEYNCDKTTGEWVVTWTVTTKDVPEGVEHYKLIKVSTSPEGTTVSKIAATEGDTFPYDVDKPLVGEQRVPGTATSASLTVKPKWENGYEGHEASGYVDLKGECKTPESPSPSPSVSSPAPPAPSTSAPAPGTGGGGPTLPTTGAATGTAVGIAAVLLAVGTGLFFFFRRRRIRFTA